MVGCAAADSLPAPARHVQPGPHPRSQGLRPVRPDLTDRSAHARTAHGGRARGARRCGFGTCLRRGIGRHRGSDVSAPCCSTSRSCDCCRLDQQHGAPRTVCRLPSGRPSDHRTAQRDEPGVARVRRDGVPHTEPRRRRTLPDLVETFRPTKHQSRSQRS